MQGKVSFAGIYDQPDPRAFYHALGMLEYQIPDHARDVFRFLIGAVRERAGSGQVTVADLCCSYGVNGALVNHSLDLDELYARYRAPELAELPSSELIAADREFYAGRRLSKTATMIGLDAAANAVGYAQRVGLLDVAASEDLEQSTPSAEFARDLAAVDLVIVTGGIGYITEATFDRLLSAHGEAPSPWVAVFVLRWVDMAPITATLEAHGLAVERVEGHTFRQRRFADDAERDHALSELRRLGVDPTGVETDGYHHTWLYLARPADEAKAIPAEGLLAPILPR